MLEAPLVDAGKALGAWLTAWIPAEAEVETPLGDVDLRGTASYAVYEWFKLPVILYLTTFVMAAIRMSISAERLERTLGRGDALGILGGILLGMVTPACSCTVTNLYAGLLAGGAHPRAAAAFLFASPAMNQFATVFMLAATGPLGAALYLLSGGVAASAVALLSDSMHLRPHLGLLHVQSCAVKSEHKGLLLRAQAEAAQLLRRLLPAVLISGALAALLNNFNLTLVSGLRAAGHSWWGPIAAAGLGLPLDVNAASTAPILFTLREIVPLGTLISAMMATTVASIP
ncbi:MAG: permease, partial [Anaerolineae bacterium]|nr:permease [Anaerolineae bacterium]